MIWVYRGVTALFCLFVLLPLIWLFYAAFMPAEAMLYLDLSTFGFQFHNLTQAMQAGLGRSFASSLLLSGLAVMGQLTLGVLLAYAIYNGLPLLWIVLLSLALPLEMLMVPLYGELQSLNLLQHPAAMVMPFLVSPLVTFLLVQSLRRLPQELVDAARLDGASEVVIVWRVLVPLIRPELIAAAVLGFAAHWNLVLYPQVMLKRDSPWQTVQVFLNDLLQGGPSQWGVMSAAALITSLPLVLLYIFLEKRIIQVFESSFK